MQNPEKNLSDPSYSVADFRVQPGGGRLRWLDTVLATASLGLFIFLLTEGEKAELDFPFHIQGEGASWTVGIAFVVWAVVAIANWKNWARKKKDAANQRVDRTAAEPRRFATGVDNSARCGFDVAW